MSCLFLLQSMIGHFFLQSAFVYIKLYYDKQFMYTRKKLRNAQANLVSE